MHEGTELAVVVVVCMTLLLGALAETFSRRIRIPYTIMMLLLGLGAGLTLALHQGGPLAGLAELVQQGTVVSPGLIVLVFLPVLVFESAFDQKVHAFRRNLGPVLVLAGPALLLATVATAAVMRLLTAGSWQWSWPAALVFGALISATDPVAVVALLREVGAPKRLGLLIEGESLLNDGTAMVVYTLLLGLLTGGASLTVGGAAGRFVLVAGGGVLVGLALGRVASAWLSRTFNAPLVEITVTLLLAYGAMLIAEVVLHVSGVIAVVTAGLWMSGPGRVQISPEVGQFLHRFWGMLAYLANTLIFFLVGVVIGGRLLDVTPLDLLLVGAAYLAVMVIRFGVTFASLPLMNRLALPVLARDATVMAWGGLRGAVSLALALAVSQMKLATPEGPSLQRQLLLVTAGVVLLTIVVNGSTIGPLLKRLGFADKPAYERVVRHGIRATLLAQVRERLMDVSQSRQLRTVHWRDILDELAAAEEAVARELRLAHDELAARPPEERARGYWHQVLHMERAAYWQALAEGTLTPRATRLLDHEIDTQLDRLQGGDLTPPARRAHGLPGWLLWLGRQLRSYRGRFGRYQFELLALRYDICRAESTAAARVLSQLDELGDADRDIRETIRATYRRYQHKSKEQLEDLRTHLPEVTRAIETQLARRIRLNLERDGVETLEHRGVMPADAAKQQRAQLDEKMKRLRATTTAVALPETAELCKDTPLFNGLDDDTLQLLADITIEKALSPGEVLFAEGDEGHSMYVIARGAMSVHAADDAEGEAPLDVLGGGDILGEIALLTGAPRSATVKAMTTVTVGEISRRDFEQLLAREPQLAERVWQAVRRRRFDNLVRGLSRYAHLGRDVRRAWVDGGQTHRLTHGAGVEVPDDALLFVAAGALHAGEHRFEGPALVPAGWGETLRSHGDSHVVVLPRQP